MYYLKSLNYLLEEIKYEKIYCNNANTSLE